MKKIISLLVVTVMLVLSLASCESGVGDFQYDYNPVPTKKISLNLYIICDDACSTTALTTIADDIADYTESKFDTEVNVIYKTASQYKNDLLEAIENTRTVPENATAQQIAAINAEKPGIVLINSKELMDELMEDKVLLDLTAMYATKAYGTLNVQINSALLEASKLTVEGSSDKKLYSVPNNRVLGEYTYLLIDKAKAKADFASSEGDWNSIKTIEDAEAILPAGSYTTVVGSYSTRFDYDKTVYYFNEDANTLPIVENPSVTAEDAFASAFAVVKGGAIPKTAADEITDAEFVSRAMQIIYAINTDSALRNLLQYGRENTNYVVVSEGRYNADGTEAADGIGDYDKIEDATAPGGYVLVPNGCFIPKVGSANYYKMNLEYTGDVFKAGVSYYPEENYGWSIDDYNNGIEQNKDVFVAE